MFSGCSGKLARRSQRLRNISASSVPLAVNQPLRQPSSLTFHRQRRWCLLPLVGEPVAAHSALLSFGLSVQDEPTVNQRQIDGGYNCVHNAKRRGWSDFSHGTPGARHQGKGTGACPLPPPETRISEDTNFRHGPVFRRPRNYREAC